MKPWCAVVATGIVASLTGCSVLQRPTAAWPWDGYPCSLAAASNTNGACKDDEDRALAMFIKSSEFCRAVHNRYEAGANQAGLAQSLVSVIGTAAGIVAVSTTGTASKAFSAMSGSTNAMQLAMGNALSATAELKRQSAVGAAASEWGAKFRDADVKKKQVVAVEMANQCWLASAKAEQQILQAVSAPTLPPPPPPSPASLAAQSAQNAQAAAQAASETAAQAATQASEAAKAAEAARVAEAAKAAEASRAAEAAKAAAAAAAKTNQVNVPVQTPAPP